MKIINRMNVLEAFQDLYQQRLCNNRIIRECIDSGLRLCKEFNNYGFDCTRYLVECRQVLNKYQSIDFEDASTEVKEEIETAFMNLLLLCYVGCKRYVSSFVNYSEDTYHMFKYVNYLIDSFNYKITNPDDYSLIDIEKITN